MSLVTISPNPRQESISHLTKHFGSRAKALAENGKLTEDAFHVKLRAVYDRHFGDLKSDLKAYAAALRELGEWIRGLEAKSFEGRSLPDSNRA